MRTLIVCLALLTLSNAQNVVIKAKHTSFMNAFVVTPGDLNGLETCFGGKLMAEMDRTAGIATRRLLYDSSYRRAVTVGVDNVKFVAPAKVDDLLIVTAEVKSVGTKSIMLHVTVKRETVSTLETICEGDYTFVCWDIHSKEAVPHGIIMESK